MGFCFDDHPWRFIVSVGPLFFEFEENNSLADYDSDEWWDWNRTLYRLTVQKWRVELRLEFDLNIWMVGYSMADIHDTGFISDRSTSRSSVTNSSTGRT